MGEFYLKNGWDHPWKIIGVLSSVGLELFLLIIGGAWIGRYFDDRLGSYPIWTAIGLVGGLLVGIISTAMAIRYLRGK